MKRIYVMLGGLQSFDGYVTSAGMFTIINRLKLLPDTKLKWYTWASYRDVVWDIDHDVRSDAASGHEDKVVVIGYSGGGWRATTVANQIKSNIDLIILYDPSPSWNMEPVGENVKHALCYQNSQKMFVPLVGWIGGGILKAPHLQVININMNHLAVQTNKALHDMTFEYVSKL